MTSWTSFKVSGPHKHTPSKLAASCRHLCTLTPAPSPWGPHLRLPASWPRQKQHPPCGLRPQLLRPMARWQVEHRRWGRGREGGRAAGDKAPAEPGSCDGRPCVRQEWFEPQLSGYWLRGLGEATWPLGISIQREQLLLGC